MRIAIIGSGYVGLATGACFAHMGNHVICVDNDEAKIAGLKKGLLPIYEPGLKELIESNLGAGRLSFTTDTAAAVRACEFIFIAVGTPQDEDGSADLQHILAVAQAIGAALPDYRIIAVKSTVPVGSGARIRAAIQEALKPGATLPEFDMVANPEFLKEGKAVSDFMSPDRIVIGADSQRAIERMRTLYLPFCRTDDSKILVMDILSAELTKYAANAMLATRISFMNELANLCEAVGANVDHVRAGIGSDHRIGRRYLFPGVGYGGSCFPKDLRALLKTAEAVEVPLHVMEAVDRANLIQKERMLNKIKAYYGPEKLADKTFAVWGLAFKPDTDDVREAPAARIIEGLLEAGASVRAYDPIAAHAFDQAFGLPIDYSDNMYRCLQDAQALILVTDWHHFRRPDFRQMKSTLAEPVIFDGRNQFEPKSMEKYGFTYISIGRPGPGTSPHPNAVPKG